MSWCSPQRPAQSVQAVVRRGNDLHAAAAERRAVRQAEISRYRRLVAVSDAPGGFGYDVRKRDKFDDLANLDLLSVPSHDRELNACG